MHQCAINEATIVVMKSSSICKSKLLNCTNTNTHQCC